MYIDKIPKSECNYLSHMNLEDIEKYILKTKRKKNLNKIKIILISNENFITFYKNGNKEAVLILKRKLFKIKDTWFWSTVCFGANEHNIDEEFIREFQNKLDWWSVSQNLILSEEFIREFQDKVKWENISACQKISEEFIREFQDKVNWECIFRNQKLSEEFRKEFAHKL